MWRTTPFHRREEAGALADDAPPGLPAGVSADEVQSADDGAGALFHRRYAALVREPRVSPEELIATVYGDLYNVTPAEFAVFQKVHGAEDGMAVGDAYVVRMAAPWDGTVREGQRTQRSFRCASHAGRLEAGRIGCRPGRSSEVLRFEIESGTRTGDRLSSLLYNHLRMA